MPVCADPTVALPGQWHFSPQDRPASQTDRTVWIPSQLPQEVPGIPDGTVWFRVDFNLPPRLLGQPLRLVLGKIDVADQTFLNGKLIGQTGSMPPHPKTAWSETRFYKIPRGLLRRHNTLSVRVFHNGALGGITSGPLGLYTEPDFQKEFHPGPAARPSFSQLVTGNGALTAVYDARTDQIVSLAPHVFSHESKDHPVGSLLRYLRPATRRKLRSIGYLDHSHIVQVTYPGVTVHYFAPFTGGPFTIRVSGDPRQVSAWNYRWDGAARLSSTTLRPGLRLFTVHPSSDPSRPAVTQLPSTSLTLVRNPNVDPLAAEVRFMARLQQRAHLPKSLRPAERQVLLQSITVLKMAQASDQEPNPKSRGQIVASLPPGAFNVAWVRDGFYACMALNRLQLFQEARAWLDFQLTADSGHYVHLAAPGGNRELGVGVPYQVSVCRYFGNGTEESFEYGAGPNLELDDFGLFLSEFADYVGRSKNTEYRQRWAPLIRDKVIAPLLHNLEPSGLMRADSGPWERYLDFKHFTYTSAVCAAGLRDWCEADTRQTATTMTDAIRRLLIWPSGFVKGNLEVQHPGDYDSHDGGTFEAFANGILDDPALWRTHLAEYRRVLQISPRRGFSRINQGDAYETAEWVLLDLRVASALARQGDRAGARRLVDRITAQAAQNHGLIPEMLRRDNSGYEGSIPMVGFGAGAYALALFDLYGEP